ncbi:RNA polymerase sigma factor [Streptomyces parvus]|uniref:RNA polymerase sigma factor n=1 Tax=Streptomyces parvus TaxID=66428 RepID=UPI0033E7EAA6
MSAATLATVFEQHRPAMTRTARRLLRAADVPTSVAEADDFVSSAFTTALRNPGDVHQPVPYVYALIRTEVRHLATRGKEHSRLERKRMSDPLGSPTPYVAGFSTRADTCFVINRALMELSISQRTAVWATHALGHTREETAVLMGKRPGTVARHTARAMATLRAGFAATVIAIVSTFGPAAFGPVQSTAHDAVPGGPPPAGAALPSLQWFSADWVLVAGAGCIAVVILYLALSSWLFARMMCNSFFFRLCYYN